MDDIENSVILIETFVDTMAFLTCVIMAAIISVCSHPSYQVVEATIWPVGSF
jgi:hypothetical protein